MHAFEKQTVHAVYLNPFHWLYVHLTGMHSRKKFRFSAHCWTAQCFLMLQCATSSKSHSLSTRQLSGFLFKAGHAFSRVKQDPKWGHYTPTILPIFSHQRSKFVDHIHLIAFLSLRSRSVEVIKIKALTFAVIGRGRPAVPVRIRMPSAVPASRPPRPPLVALVEGRPVIVRALSPAPAATRADPQKQPYIPAIADGQGRPRRLQIPHTCF